MNRATHNQHHITPFANIQHAIKRSSVNAKPVMPAEDYTILEASSDTMAGKTFGYMEEALSNLLTKYDVQKKHWHSALKGSLTLLRQARTSLKHALEKIEQQDERIQLLEQLITIDELTGLSNRRGFISAFTRELDRTRRNISKGGLMIIIDLDNFKSINEAHGIAAGDACLKTVANFITQQQRMMDIAARVGGDEFVMLLCHTNRDEALNRSQKIAWKLNTLTYEHKGQKIDIHASVGIKEYGKGDNPDDVFSQTGTSMCDDENSKEQPQKKYA